METLTALKYDSEIPVSTSFSFLTKKTPDLRRKKSENIYTDYLTKNKARNYVTEDEYWERYYEHPDFRYEWNNGYLEEKPMSDFLGYQMDAWFEELLRQYLLSNPIGKLVGCDIGFRMKMKNRVSIRKPDLSVVLNNNPAKINPRDRTYKGLYDLCIEFLSYSSKREIERDTVIKKNEYKKAGVKEYYILDPRGRETIFYKLNNRGVFQPIQPVKNIIRSSILPGFQFKISDLYIRPLLHTLINNKIYNNYVLPFYYQEKKRADQADKRADQADKRAEQAGKKAEQADKRAVQEKEARLYAEEQLKKLNIKLKELGTSV